MRDLFDNQKIAKYWAPFLLISVVAILAGCSAGTTTATGTSGTGGTGGTGGTTGTTAGTPSMTIALGSNSISNGTSTTVNATVKDGTGALVPNTVVTFSTDLTMATMTPSNGTALTDPSGVASITLTGGANLGATIITASAQVGTTAVTGSSGYTVGAVAVTISPPVFGANPLSAFGTTSVTATVAGGGASSQTVNFSSICSSTNKAVLSTGISTVAGVATASYRDKGCASTDTITVTVSGGLATNTATLVVIPPTTGSIQYVSSVPTNISLKGTGGTEVSQVTFKVLDTGGNPLSGKLVTFGLSTTVGGIILTPNTGVAPFAIGSATSGSDGTVVTNVNAGTMSTPVRVTASTVGAGGVSLTTQSSQLTITTGIPDQFGTSLASTMWNIEGWDVDGTTAVLTASLADHFKNPVPNGTAVVFTAESGSVIGSCTTLDGNCTTTYRSQGTRPVDGRATVLMYAVGEETFTDLNANGWADVTLSPAVLKNEMIDPNGNPTDMPEAWVDYNEDGIYNAATEPYIDFNQDTIYNPADGKFSGVLCDDVTTGRSSPGTCSPNKTIHVRQSGVMVNSSSTAIIEINNGNIITVPTCASGGAPLGIVVTVVDIHGNAMPAGTTIDFSTDNGTVASSAREIIGSTSSCRTNDPVTGAAFPCPASVASATFGDIPVRLQTDAAPPTCTNAKTSGTFTVTVTTPTNAAAFKTTKTVKTMTIND